MFLAFTLFTFSAAFDRAHHSVLEAPLLGSWIALSLDLPSASLVPLVSPGCLSWCLLSSHVLNDAVPEGSVLSPLLLTFLPLFTTHSPTLLSCLRLLSVGFNLGWGIKYHLYANDVHIHIFIHNCPSELKFRPSNPTAYSTPSLRNLPGLSDFNLSETELLDLSPQTCSYLMILSSKSRITRDPLLWSHPWLLCFLHILYSNLQHILLTLLSEYDHFIQRYFNSSLSPHLPGLVSATTCQLASLLLLLQLEFYPVARGTSLNCKSGRVIPLLRACRAFPHS